MNTERVIGAQDITIQQNLGLSPLTYAGIGNKALNYIPRNAQSASVSINSYLINKDYFLEATTGNSLHNLYLLRNKTDLSTVFSMVSGYFNQFSCNYSIGNVPEISTSFIGLRDAGMIQTGNLPYDCANQLNTISNSNIDITGTVLIPYGNSISFTLDNLVNTNRVQSFNLQANSNKQAIYFMGSKYPKRVDLYSSDINLNITFEMGDYEAKRLRNFPQSGTVRNLSLTIGDYSNNATICSYGFNNLNLISEEYSNSVNGFVSVSQSWNNRVF